MEQTSKDTIKLEHGSGGWLSKQLIDDIIYPFFKCRRYPALTDSSTFSIDGQVLFTTDTYVVDPPFFFFFFIGKLAVNGTCNDISVAGGSPMYLSL